MPMICPCCKRKLEELYESVYGEPCGIWRCNECRWPMNRWVVLNGNLCKYTVTEAAAS
jgi:predicted RNA-binding Zn-ribbon protein involved in translation (DUF1610 family)